MSIARQDDMKRWRVPVRADTFAQPEPTLRVLVQQVQVRVHRVPQALIDHKLLRWRVGFVRLANFWIFLELLHQPVAEIALQVRMLAPLALRVASSVQKANFSLSLEH